MWHDFEALTVALPGADRRLDVGVANGRPFVVMAGLGFDAQMLGGASEEMKRRMGWPAYVLSGLRHLRERPVVVWLRADHGPRRRFRASAVIAGNVGSLRGHVRLFPDAVPDDGVLDVAVLTAGTWSQWLRLAVDVLSRRATGRLASLTCRDLIVDARRARPWQVDGEVIGPTRRLRITLRAGDLVVRVPAPPAR